MKFIKSYITIILSVLIVFPAIAQVDRSTRPEPGPAPVINIPEAEEFELDNGLRVIVVENDRLPRVSYNLRLVHPSILEGEYKGYVDIAGQLLRNGTSNRTKEEIDDAIDFIGANVNTHGRGFFASSLSRHNDTLLELLSDILLNPTFPTEEFERIRNQRKSNLATQRNDPSYMIRVLYNKLVFGEGHPYSEAETEQTLSNITIEKCKQYYEDYFRPNSAYLIVVGDVEADKVKAQLQNYFGDWQARPVPEVEYPEVSPPAERMVSVIDRPLAVQSTLRVGYAVDFKPDDEDRIAASLMNTILGGGMFRLNENLRETYGFTYGAYSNLERDNLTGRFSIFTDVGTEVTDSAVQEILNEMYKMVLEPVSEEELQTAKNYLTGVFALRLAEPRTVADFAFEIAHYGLPDDYFVNYLKTLNAVTVEDIQRVAGRFILPENCHIMVAGKADDISEGLKKFAMDGEVHLYNQNFERVKKEKREIPDGLTADIVMENYFEAIGGKANLKELKDIKQVQGASIMGMDLEIITYQKAPHYLKQKTVAPGQKSVQVFDGEKAVIISPTGKQEFTEGPVFEMVKRQSVFNAELKYKELGIEKNLLSVETVNGKNAYRLESVTPEGVKSYEYYDTETGLKIKTVSDQGNAYMSDYKMFGNVMFPTKIRHEAGPQVINATVKSIEINKGISKDIFIVE